MANTKKYVSLDKLSLYDEKIKKYLADADAAVLKSAKDYSDETLTLANNNAASLANTAEANAKAHADSKDAAIQAAHKAGTDAATAAGVADGKAVQAQAEVDALEAYVGTFVASEGVDTVVKYIDAKTANIASDETVGAIADRVTAVEGDVATIKANYLDGDDKTELEGKITAVQSAVDTEKGRAEGVESGLRTDIDTVMGDYLKASDKSDLEGKIALKADKTALDAVSAVANVAATQTALQGEIDRATGEEARIEGLVTAEAQRAAEAEAGLQTQINTIMNNPDTEGVINSINEFTQYIADHGEIADGFRADIDANAKAISDHETLAAQTYETKEDATAKYDELVELVGEKAVQADWNQNDSTAADYVKNRTHYDNSAIEYVFKDLPASGMQEGSMGMGTLAYPNGEVVTIEEGKTYILNFNGQNCTATASSDYIQFSGIKNPVNPNSNMSARVTPNYIQVLGAYDYSYDWASSDLTFTICSGTMDIKQLDEKFIPDTIARVADVDDVAGRMTDAEGKISTLEGKVGANETAIAELQVADTDIIKRIVAVEAQLGDGEGSVTDLIADAKTEAVSEAVAAAASDAAAKDEVVLAAAKKYADDEDAKIETRVDALEAASASHALASDLTALGGRVTTAEGKVSTLEGKMTAVETKAGANETAIGNLQTAVNGKAAQSDLTTATDRITALETWHTNFVECSQEDINGLFA